VPLTESSIYNRFFIVRSPKIGVLGAILGVGAKIFGGNPLEMQRPHIYAFSDIFGPDLTRLVVTFCMGKPFAIGENLGKFGGHSSPTRSRRKTSLPEGTPLDLRLPHGKIGIILRCNPWAVGWSPEGTFYGFCMGKIGQNPKSGQL